MLQITGCHGSGDAYSSTAFDCSLAAPCLVSYRSRGRPWQGFSSGFPENHIWAATPSDYRGNHVSTVHSNDHWTNVEYVFPVGKLLTHRLSRPRPTIGSDYSPAVFMHVHIGDGTYMEGDYTASISSTHFMFEGYDFDCAVTMLDDVVIQRYTGSANQAAAINAAVQPASILFADDFESGITGWHGPADAPRPQTALVTEDRNRGSMVLAMQDCISGGDAFSTASFECSVRTHA